jgi:hypothetical protein
VLKILGLGEPQYLNCVIKKDLGVMTPESNDDDDVENLGLGTPFFSIVLCVLKKILGLGQPQ